MAAANFDPAGKLDLVFRVARAGAKTLNFVDTNGEAFSLSGRVFQFNLKEKANNDENVFQLLDGDGLTVGASSIVIEVDEEETAIRPKTYYWELYETVGKKTWLCGNAYFISRDPSSENDALTATVRLDPDTITVTISNPVSTSEAGETQTSDQETILGDGLETPFYVADGQFDTYGAAEVVAKEGLLREWDNTQNKFPDSGGSGTAGAIERHNRFIGVGVGNWEILTGQGSEQVVDGMEFIAKIDAPGQTPANWWVK
jgi:hypothetical protein